MVLTVFHTCRIAYIECHSPENAMTLKNWFENKFVLAIHRTVDVLTELLMGMQRLSKPSSHGDFHKLSEWQSVPNTAQRYVVSSFPAGFAAYAPKRQR